MVRLFKMEVELHQESEVKRQELACMSDYTALGVFEFLDSSRINFLDCKSFSNFFKRIGKPIAEEDINSLFRRMEYDQD